MRVLPGVRKQLKLREPAVGVVLIAEDGAMTEERQRALRSTCERIAGDDCELIGPVQVRDDALVVEFDGRDLELKSAEGRRVHKVGDFFIADGIWNSVRRPDELVTAILVPLPPAGRIAAYEKLRQRGSIDFPLLSVAVAGELGQDGTVEDLRVVVSALGSRPRIVSGLDRIAVGERLTDDVVEAVAERAHAQSHPLDNIIVDPEWRRAMVPVHVRRALRGALASQAGRSAA